MARLPALGCCALVLALGLNAGVQADSSQPIDIEPHFSQAASEAVLPPVRDWNGKSRALLARKDDPWITPAEKSDFRLTPSYNDTIAWLQKLATAAPELKLISLGKSPEGRDIWMVVANRDRVFTPEALRKNNKPIVLAQAGIHSGEIDGKDAGLMLLRDMTVGGTKRDLLAQANFLFVPILNVDGHENGSKFGRVNQRGPEITGWRTNAKNLNLNRDYTKLDTPEIRAIVRALNQWQPDLYLDLHVTDGADYQYDVTFGANEGSGHSPAIAQWLSSTFTPAVTNSLTSMGHIPGPTDVANLVTPADLSKGITHWMADARFSNGYGDLRHLPTILVEDHSLKPYQQRVLGAYVLLESALRTTGKNVVTLRDAIAADRHLRPATVPLAWELDMKTPGGSIDYQAIESRVIPSQISGGLRIEYTGKPITMQIPYYRNNRATVSVTRPRAYWIPPAWDDIVQRLELHGIQMEQIREPRDVHVTSYRLENAKLLPASKDVEEQPFEGHFQLTAKPIAFQHTEHFPAGSVRVPTDQPLGDLAVALLEPDSPDSFFRWGFFNQVLQQTEYIEGYILEPMAERMLASDPKLAQEFRDKLARDEAFRNSPTERLRWFYARTPFRDKRWKLYPIGREE